MKYIKNATFKCATCKTKFTDMNHYDTKQAWDCCGEIVCKNDKYKAYFGFGSIFDTNVYEIDPELITSYAISLGDVCDDCWIKMLAKYLECNKIKITYQLPDSIQIWDKQHPLYNKFTQYKETAYNVIIHN